MPEGMSFRRKNRQRSPVRLPKTEKMSTGIGAGKRRPGKADRRAGTDATLAETGTSATGMTPATEEAGTAMMNITGQDGAGDSREDTSDHHPTIVTGDPEAEASDTTDSRCHDPEAGSPTTGVVIGPTGNRTTTITGDRGDTRRVTGIRKDEMITTGNRKPEESGRSETSRKPENSQHRKPEESRSTTAEHRKSLPEVTAVRETSSEKGPETTKLPEPRKDTTHHETQPVVIHDSPAANSGNRKTQSQTTEVTDPPTRPFMQVTEGDREVADITTAASCTSVREGTPSPSDWHWKADDSEESADAGKRTRSRKDILRMVADIDELKDTVVFDTVRPRGKGTAAKALAQRDVKPNEIPKAVKAPEWTAELKGIIDGKISGKRDRGKSDGPLTKDFLEGPIKTNLWRFVVDDMPPPLTVPKVPQTMVDWLPDIPNKVTVPVKYLETLDATGRGIVQASVYGDVTAAALMYTGYALNSLWQTYSNKVQKVIENLPEQYQELFPEAPNPAPTLLEMDDLSTECSEAVMRAHDLGWYISTNSRLVRRDLVISKLPKNVPSANKVTLRTAPIEIRSDTGKPLLFDPKAVDEAKEAEKRELERSLLTQKTAPPKPQPPQKKQETGNKKEQGPKKENTGKKTTNFNSKPDNSHYKKKGGGGGGGGAPKGKDTRKN